MSRVFFHCSPPYWSTQGFSCDLEQVSLPRACSLHGAPSLAPSIGATGGPPCPPSISIGADNLNSNLQASVSNLHPLSRLSSPGDTFLMSPDSSACH